MLTDFWEKWGTFWFGHHSPLSSIANKPLSPALGSEDPPVLLPSKMQFCPQVPKLHFVQLWSCLPFSFLSQLPPPLSPRLVLIHKTGFFKNRMKKVCIYKGLLTFKKDTLPLGTTKMSLEDITLHEISQTQKEKYCTISLTCGLF